MELRAALKCLAAAFVMLTTAAALAQPAQDLPTATPIKHLIVIFQENVSFDHYFGTYPEAENNPGETPFVAKHHTLRRINSLRMPLDVTSGFEPIPGTDLLNANPNSPVGSGAQINGADAANPFRLGPLQALTADQGHNYKPEQQASDNGLMDAFPAFVGAGGTPAGTGKSLVMGYYDGNTVTALWNYAQDFAINDNNWSTTFGPSTPGALNLISGQTSGFAEFINVDVSGTLLHDTHEVSDSNGNYTEIGDGDPLYDVCSSPTLDQIAMNGRNLGDLLNARNISWGWFEGGFDLTIVNPDGTTGCNRHTNPTAPGTPQSTSNDYIPHHEPFQYYASTRNPSHARSSSLAAIGHPLIPGSDQPDPANHQYETTISSPS